MFKPLLGLHDCSSAPSNLVVVMFVRQAALQALQARSFFLESALDICIFLHFSTPPKKCEVRAAVECALGAHSSPSTQGQLMATGASGSDPTTCSGGVSTTRTTAGPTGTTSVPPTPVALALGALSGGAALELAPSCTTLTMVWRLLG